MPVFVSAIRQSTCLIAAKIPNYPLRRFPLFSAYSSVAAEQFMIHLEKNQTHVEKTLNRVKAKLDSNCITQVVERCAANKPQLGLRFFIWAGMHPTHIHCSYLYEKACKLLDVEQNPQIVADVVDEYIAERYFVSIKMFKVVLNLCRAAKDANLGLWVLRKMKETNCMPDTVSYNQVIRLLVEKSKMDEAMGLMREMGSIDLYPDMVTYVLIIKGFCGAGRLSDAFGLVELMKGHGVVLPSKVLYGTLIEGICTHGSLKVAFESLGGVEKQNGECKPNVITYTSIIKVFVEKGRAMEALGILDRMDELGVKPNKVTFTTLLDGLCKQGHIEEAREAINKYSGGGLEYDELCSIYVSSLLRAGKHEESEKMFRMMMARGMRPHALASRDIIRMMISEGRVLDGFSLFDALEKSGNLRTVESGVYSALLAKLCQEGYFEEASRLVSIMVEGGVPPKPSLAENIIQHLNASGQHDLVAAVSNINKQFEGAHTASLCC